MARKTEGERLILKDRTEIEDGRAGEMDGFLWIWIGGMTMAEAAEIAFNPEKTAKIRYQYGEMEDIFTGYTNCTSMGIGPDGKISICLRRDEHV